LKLAIDKKGQLWQIDRWGNYFIHSDPAPADAVVIQADFEDGFTATAEEYSTAFGIAFGIRNYNMRVLAQSTTYELTVTELTSLMAKELNVAENRITLLFKTREVGDGFGSPILETYAVEVIVTGPTPDGFRDQSNDSHP
jgi:hypothetical protein